MTLFNIHRIEQILLNTEFNQGELEEKLNLPNKFFSKVKEDGSSISVSDLCKLANSVNADISEFFHSSDDVENKEKKINFGRSLFMQYREIEDKIKDFNLPDVFNYKSPNSDDVVIQTSEHSSCQLNYAIQKEKYDRLLKIKNIMSFTITCVVAGIECDKEIKESIESDLFSLLTINVGYRYLNTDRFLLKRLSDKACIMLVDNLEYKKLLPL